MLKYFSQGFKLISISLSPNIEKDDIRLALKMLFSPWKWKKGRAAETLEKEFKKYLNLRYAFSFNSGRSALMAILSSFDLEQGSEVLIQAFTCNAAVNPIIWSELIPVYVDCDKTTFNIDLEDLKRKITSRSRILIVQHTFGVPADMDKIVEICRQNSLILIEDCAHSLGAEFNSKKAGTFGDASFFSFSRDKIISSVYGGMAATNDDKIAEKIKGFQQRIKYPSRYWIKQQLFHPVLMNWLIMSFYGFFGKYLLVLFQWIYIFSKAVHWKEKRGQKPGYFPRKMPNALAVLALNQFNKLDKFNAHRKEIAAFYYNELKNSDFQLPVNRGVFLRFAIKHPKAHQIIREAWKENILIGDWYTSPVAPDDTKLEQLRYKVGSCPQAEELAKITLNLPTHINISQFQAQKIVNLLKKYGK